MQRKTKKQRIEEKRDLIRYIGWMRGSAVTGLEKRIPAKENGYAECLKIIKEQLNFMEEHLRADVGDSWL